MIQALEAHNNVKKFTMLRYTAYDPVDFSRVYDDDEATANLYFNRVPHLEEIGICRAREYPYVNVDSGKVFVRIKRQPLKLTSPVGKEDGSGSNINDKVEKTDKINMITMTYKTGNTGMTSMTDKTDTTRRETRKLLRVYNCTQSDDYRIKQLELGRIPSMPDRNPTSAGVANRDPEYTMFELEWKWARHQTLKAMYEREAAVEAAAIKSAVEVQPEVVASATKATRIDVAAGGVPDMPVVEENAPSADDEPAGIPAVATATTVANGSLSSMFGGGVTAAAPHAAAHPGPIVPPSIFGGGPVAAAAPNPLQGQANSQSDRKGNASSSGSASSHSA